MATFSFPPYLDDAAGPYYVYRADWSFADWVSNRIALPESASPNQGRWSGATVTDGTWYVFRGSTQPANWAEAVGVWSTPEASSSGTGSGEHATPIRVHSGGVNIRGALVSAFSGSSLLAWGSTAQTTGLVTLNLDAGSKTLNVSASGFQSVSAQAITVPVSGTVVIELTPQSIAPPPGIAGQSPPAPTQSYRVQQSPPSLSRTLWLMAS
jgi:hypothetical protein